MHSLFLAQSLAVLQHVCFTHALQPGAGYPNPPQERPHSALQLLSRHALTSTNVSERVKKVVHRARQAPSSPQDMLQSQAGSQAASSWHAVASVQQF
jgi:hypothetical protein